MNASPSAKIKVEIGAAIRNAMEKCGYDPAKLEGTLDFARGFGDMACSVAFRIGKEKGMNPKDVAGSIASAMSKPACVGEVRVEGGYMNFALVRESYVSDTLDYAFGIEVGAAASDLGNGEKVIVEYPSVNPNKPWHLGHLKNAVLGDAVANICAGAGYSVEREDFIEDLGLQVVESTWSYINVNKDPKGEKFDHWMGEEYVKINRHMEVNNIKNELSALLQKMESPGTSESKMARRLAETCVRAQNETAFAYGIYRDILVWETDMVAVDLFKKAIAMLVQAGFAKRLVDGQYDNCIGIDLGAISDLPPEFRGLKEKIKVLVRRDGTPTYVAKDIAFHMWKFGMVQDPFRYSEFIAAQPNGRPLYTTTSVDGKPMGFGRVKRAINIIDVRQDYPQSLLKLAFGAMGRADIAAGITHLSYGELELESGLSLSGRKGNWIGNTADDLLSEAKKKAMEILSDSRFKLTESEKDDVSSKVAIAAVKFDLLRQAPEKKTVFSWKRALNFEVVSGPYCQYMYARARRLLEDSKIGEAEIGKAGRAALGSDSEFELVKLISRLSDVVDKACTELRPNTLATYCIDLSAAFSKFYEDMPILKASSAEERVARLALTLSFARSIKYALALLGIETLDRM